MNWGNTFPIEAAEKLFQRDLKWLKEKLEENSFF
jgi:hypothetical protein